MAPTKGPTQKTWGRARGRLAGVLLSPFPLKGSLTR